MVSSFYHKVHFSKKNLILFCIQMGRFTGVLYWDLYSTSLLEHMALLFAITCTLHMDLCIWHVRHNSIDAIWVCLHLKHSSLSFEHFDCYMVSDSIESSLCIEIIVSKSDFNWICNQINDVQFILLQRIWCNFILKSISPGDIAIVN